MSEEDVPNAIVTEMVDTVALLTDTTQPIDTENLTDSSNGSIKQGEFAITSTPTDDHEELPRFNLSSLSAP